MKTTGIIKIVMVLLALAALASPARAADTRWRHEPATPGNWFEPTNWFGGVPTSSDYVWIDNGGTAVIASGAAEGRVLLVGYYSAGTVRQTGGTHTITRNMRIAPNRGAVGYYELSGGELLTKHNMSIGDSGTGTFTQTGGTNTVMGQLELGYGRSSSSHYYLEGGNLNAHEIRMGNSAPYIFLQTGGTNTVGHLRVTRGTYDLRNGLLSGEQEWIGYDCHTTFVQSGGTNRAGFFALNTGSTYEISGGTLRVDNSGQSQGTLDFKGSSAKLSVAGGLLALSRGSILNAEAATLETAPDTLTIFREGFDPNSEFGAVTGPGMIHTRGSQIFVAQGKGFSGGGGIYDPVRCEGAINMCRTPQSAFNDFKNDSYLYGGVTVANGGTVNVEGVIYFDNGTSGGIEATGGSIHTTSMIIGQTASGSFVQAGGVNTVTRGLEVGLDGGAQGTYELHNGRLEAQVTIIGRHGTGRFIQGGGEVDIPRSILGLGYARGGDGRYELQDGTLAANTEQIGYRSDGTFIQTGGTNTVGNFLELGHYGDGRGRYELHGGRLVAPKEIVGRSTDGEFIQTGGTNTVNGDVIIGRYSKGSGLYVISGGTLSAANLNVGSDGRGTFHVVGGTATIGIYSYLQGTNGELVSQIDATGLATIVASGSATLGETWTVLDSGAPYGVFDVLTAGGGISGSFDSVSLPGTPANWSWGIDDGTTLWVGYLPLDVLIDIKPRSDPNSINLLAKGVLPVAILGSEMIDVAEIDQTTLELAGSRPQERGKSGRLGALEDVNGDGFLDLVVRFAIGEVELDPDATEAELTGLLLDGTGIFGTDAVRLVGGKGIDGATLQHIPEPASATLLLIGLPWLMRRRSRR